MIRQELQKKIYGLEVKIMELEKVLKIIAKMPCIYTLLGEDTSDCGCASCLAKKALKEGE